MKFIVTTPDGKELLVDEEHVCSKNSPLQCTKYSKDIMDTYLLLAGEKGYTIKQVDE